VGAFEAAMKSAGKPVDVKIYEGAPHAFANPNNPWKGYREASARDAWAGPRPSSPSTSRSRRHAGARGAAPVDQA
jgi:acetyl esterase/lipase